MQPINHIKTNQLVNTVNDRSQTPIIPFPQREREYCSLGWHEKAIHHIDLAEHELDEKLPNFAFQNWLDDRGKEIKRFFSPLKEFNTWLDSNGHGAWFEQLGIFLAKLPLRAVRNIIRLLYAVVKTAIYAAGHPVKAAMKLARLLIHLLVALTKPETWSKMGSGIAGGSVGQFAVTGNPFALIGIAVGGAMTLGGLTAGAIKAAVDTRSMDRVKEQLIKQAKELPEALLTGFLMGLILGAIQKATTAEAPKPQEALSAEKVPPTRPMAQYQYAVDNSAAPQPQSTGFNSSPLVDAVNELTAQVKNNLLQLPPDPLPQTFDLQAVMDKLALYDAMTKLEIAQMNAWTDFLIKQMKG